MSPPKPGLDHRPLHASFMVDKVALEQVVLQVLRFSPVSNIPPMPHTRLHLNTVLTKEKSGQVWDLTRYLSDINTATTKYFFSGCFRAKCYKQTETCSRITVQVIITITDINFNKPNDDEIS